MPTAATMWGRGRFDTTTRAAVGHAVWVNTRANVKEKKRAIRRANDLWVVRKCGEGDSLPDEWACWGQRRGVNDPRDRSVHVQRAVVGHLAEPHVVNALLKEHSATPCAVIKVAVCLGRWPCGWDELQDVAVPSAPAR